MMTGSKRSSFNVALNHLVILAKDKRKTADFITELLDLDDATAADGPVPGFFCCIRFDNDVTVLIAESKEHPAGHYAFKVTGEHFETLLNKLKRETRDFWADPRMEKPFECYEEDGKKGLYVVCPSGHGLEILTDLQVDNER
ncbi:VOC family protein [Parapedobacter composti]|nr:VOC family protein [Parapedobacter composti]